MKSKKLSAAVIIVLAAIIVCETLYLASEKTGGGVWEPKLSFLGDIENAVSLQYDGGDYLLPSGQCEKHSFTFEGERYSGVLLSDVLKQAGVISGDSHIYFAGYDGMLSSIDASALGENYLVFGENGWEVMNEGYPASSNVKAMEYVVTVADDPADVPSSVTVTDDNGHERILSPGTLFLEDSVSSRSFHGRSEKNGQAVAVFTTDSWTEIGGERLRLEGNRIIGMSENGQGE